MKLVNINSLTMDVVKNLPSSIPPRKIEYSEVEMVVRTVLKCLNILYNKGELTAIIDTLRTDRVGES